VVVQREITRKNDEETKRVLKLVKLQSECDEILCNSEKYNTNILNNIIAQVAAVKSKDAPVTRHAPEPK
jgi:hypothetical protein